MLGGARAGTANKLHVSFENKMFWPFEMNGTILFQNIPSVLSRRGFNKFDSKHKKSEIAGTIFFKASSGDKNAFLKY